MSESLSVSVDAPSGIMTGAIAPNGDPLSSSTTSTLRVRANSRERSAFTYYAGAVFFVTTSFVLTFALQRFFPYPFLFFFFGAVVASAWFGGGKPGLLS